MTEALLSPSEQDQLLQLARSSVEYGLANGRALPIDPGEFPDHLQTPGAAFVTLEKRRQLRGCIGSVKAYRSLVNDIAENAWNAAFRDPRFSPVTRAELPELHFEISILTCPRLMKFDSWDDLKRQLVPGRDGLRTLS